LRDRFRVRLQIGIVLRLLGEDLKDVRLVDCPHDLLDYEETPRRCHFQRHAGHRNDREIDLDLQVLDIVLRVGCGRPNGVSAFRRCCERAIEFDTTSRRKSVAWYRADRLPQRNRP
jgi:hypothetical protein